MDAIILKLVRIDGDYAILRTEQGVENRMARALLPPEADEGDTIILENFEYRIATDE